MATRLKTDKIQFGTNYFSLPLILSAQGMSGSLRYWSTEKIVKDAQEALKVANALLPSPYRAINSSRKLTGRGDPPQAVWLVTVGLPEGSDADDLVQNLSGYFTTWEP